MKDRKGLLASAIIAVCFLYTGSAYMSQFYRLTQFCDEATVDIITSGWFYLLQAAGIGIYMLGYRKRPSLFGDGRFFALLLALGLIPMSLAQLTTSDGLLIACGCIFSLLIGLYFGYYLTLFAAHVAPKCSATFYGIAYAIGSLGTYALSLLGDGSFLTSKWITILYGILAAVTIVLALSGRAEKKEQADLAKDVPSEELAKTISPDERANDSHVRSLSMIIAVMMVISVIGSGLYYSVPIAADINWNLIRAFYALGLILTGIVMDRDRRAGEILAAASLVYPLIAFSLVGEGLNGMLVLSLSYLFRGCLTVYYVISFTDIGASDPDRLFLAPTGLMISRVVEALLTFVLIYVKVPVLAQIVIVALFAVLLIVLMSKRLSRAKEPVTANAVATDLTTRNPQEHLSEKPEPMSEEKRHALFFEEHRLTAREAQILSLLADGLTDDEISARMNISHSTVRFHVSNILKKTGTASRVEAVRLMQKFG